MFKKKGGTSSSESGREDKNMDFNQSILKAMLETK